MVETRTEKIWLSDAGIMYFQAKPVNKHLIEDAIENINCGKDVARGKAYPAIIDIRKSKFVSAEARNLYISEENSTIKICALLVGSPVSRILGNFFIGLNKTSFPTKIFTKETLAIEWLERHG